MTAGRERHTVAPGLVDAACTTGDVLTVDGGRHIV
ncbi:hypothetical protein ABH940_005723 [Streptacidiphilus sp. BW17]